MSLLKTGACFTNALEANCPTIVNCITALPVGAAGVAGTTQVLGKDGQYHTLPTASSPVAPDGSETKVIAGANTTVSGTGTTANPYAISAIPYFHAANTTGECPALNFTPGTQNVGDVLFTSTLLSVTNPSSILPASGTFTSEVNGFVAVTYPGSFYVVKTQISKNGGAFTDLSSMSFSNQGGSAPENYGGSAIPTKTDSISIPAGGVATIQTRVVLAFKGALTVNDIITGVCISQNISVTNHN